MPNDATKKTAGQGEAQDDDGAITIEKSDVHPAMLTAKPKSEGQLYTLRRGDEVQQVTEEELVRRAQIGWNGERLAQEAAEIRKDASKSIAADEDMRAVFEDNDVDAFRRLGAKYGVESAQVEAIAKRSFEDSGAEDDEDEDIVEDYYTESRAGKVARSQEDSQVSYQDLSPDVQRVVQKVEKERIDEIVNNALDNDEEIAYNMEARDDKGRVAIRTYVDDKIQGRLQAFGGDFGDGTRILGEILPELREHLQALGTPGQRTQMGLGQAPGGGDTEIYPRKLPDHVSSTEGEDFEQHIFDTMKYHQGQAERGKN